jgi:hypothetical protein
MLRHIFYWIEFCLLGFEKRLSARVLPAITLAAHTLKESVPTAYPVDQPITCREYAPSITHN